MTMTDHVDKLRVEQDTLQRTINLALHSRAYHLQRADSDLERLHRCQARLNDVLNDLVMHTLGNPRPNATPTPNGE